MIYCHTRLTVKLCLAKTCSESRHFSCATVLVIMMGFLLFLVIVIGFLRIAHPGNLSHFKIYPRIVANNEVINLCLVLVGVYLVKTKCDNIYYSGNRRRCRGKQG